MTHKLRVGQEVVVPIGLRQHAATVLEQQPDGRIWVRITIAGSDEPVYSSYDLDQITLKPGHKKSVSAPRPTASV